MGAVFNCLFAFVLAFILWMVGQPVSEEERTTVIGFVQETVTDAKRQKSFTSPAFTAGLMAGDCIISIDGVTVSNFGEINRTIMMGAGRTPDARPKVTFKIERKGQLLDVDVFPELLKTGPFSNHLMRFIGIYPKQTLEVAEIMENSPASLAGIRPKDIICELNGNPAHSLFALQEILQKHPTDAIQLLVRRGEKSLNILLTPQMVPYTRPVVKIWQKGERKSFAEIIPVQPDTKKSAARLDLSKPETHAWLQVFDVQGVGSIFDALKEGDRIVSLNRQKIGSLRDMMNGFQKNSAAAATLTVKRAKSDTVVELQLSNVVFSIKKPQEIALLGVQIAQPTKIVHVNPFKQCQDSFLMTWNTLKSLVNKDSDVKLNQLMGPPGIIRALHKFSTEGFRLLFWFVIVLNVNLAILNLLPIPILDGGHILFAGIEAIIRRPLNEKFINTIQMMFLFLFLALMLYVTFFDVKRWRGDVKTKDLYAKQAQLQIEPRFWR
jgi:regulator of sigma E protease